MKSGSNTTLVRILCANRLRDGFMTTPVTYSKLCAFLGIHHRSSRRDIFVWKKKQLNNCARQLNTDLKGSFDMKANNCETCVHAFDTWCDEFKCPILEQEKNKIKICFGYQEKQFENLFEFLESERRKKES